MWRSDRMDCCSVDARPFPDASVRVGATIEWPWPWLWQAWQQRVVQPSPIHYASPARSQIFGHGLTRSCQGLPFPWRGGGLPAARGAMKREGKQGRLVIAVDGPVGAGKSTAARLLAERLGCRYIDSGAMYRALAWKALQMDLDLADERRLMRLLGDTSITLEGSGDGLVVLVDGQEVSREIRTPEGEHASSKISTLAGIRRVMVARQREMASQGGVVMDGRDIGTVVFPDADVKFYLEARLEEGAQRRD